MTTICQRIIVYLNENTVFFLDLDEDAIHDMLFSWIPSDDVTDNGVMDSSSLSLETKADTELWVTVNCICYCIARCVYSKHSNVFQFSSQGKPKIFPY